MHIQFSRMLIVVCAVVVFSIPVKLFGQIFSKVTDASNPLVADPGDAGYAGCSWIDYNNDGLLDLFVNGSMLYKNLGEGKFSRDLNNEKYFGLGNSWADFDNDGYLDFYISGGKSLLFKNDGNGVFHRVLNGATGDSTGNRGWSCAWGDYDNDGFVDLVVTHPAGFVGVPTTNHLFHNSADGTLAVNNSTPVTVGQAPYTIATWSDYDGDGDLDLSIGSGPANGTVEPDYLYTNQLKELGSANFPRIVTGPLATGARDGQIFNWIDYDNDGDLDAYVTNYGGTTNGMANQLYRNDGAGVFTLMTSGDVGPIVTHNERSLASVWDDFDNDGYLDCLVTNDATAPLRYYRNNGNGTFSEDLTSIGTLSGPGPHRGAAAGDYDGDGAVDLFVSGPTGKRLLLHNNVTMNHWIFIKCIGTTSNRAAIGTKLKIRTTVNGIPVWQMREISAQNSFNGQNDLRVHFGLAEATIIDSLVIQWPRGLEQRFANISANHVYSILEGAGMTDGQIPCSPLLLSPAPQSVEPFGRPLLLWSSSPGATGYRLQISTDSMFTTLAFDTVGADTSFQFPFLQNARTYYWHVRAIYSTYLTSGWTDRSDFANGTASVYSFSKAWNLVSVPAVPEDRRTSAIFPSAISVAYAYVAGAYHGEDSLNIGTGYWLKYPANTGEIIAGERIDVDSVDVISGWNLIGSISAPVPVSSIVTAPEPMELSGVFGYQGSYVRVDTLRPGFGYWVKVDRAGKLILQKQ